MKGARFETEREMVYDRVLIAVDGSDEARRAARRGLELARAFEADVDVVYVIERSTLHLTRTEAEKSRLKESAEAALGDIEALASETGQSVATELTDGKPAVRISECATERNADLIVVGRQGQTGVGRRLLGGVTEKILNRSEVPVFVVPDGDSGSTNGYSRLLVPTDGSNNAEAAIPHGAAIGQHHGSDVHVLNVADLQAAGGMFDAGGVDTEFVDRLEERGREAVEKVSGRIEEAAPNATVMTATERTASYGGAAATIREYVEENEIDLIVMGSHGRSNIGRHVIGSVASSVLRTVDVPVLVVTQPS